MNDRYRPGRSGQVARLHAVLRITDRLLVSPFGHAHALQANRETRRIHGDYALTGEDILSSARFDDSMGINAWPMEMHEDGAIRWGFPRDAQRA